MVFYDVYEEAMKLKVTIDEYKISTDSLRGIKDFTLYENIEQIFLKKDQPAYNTYLAPIIMFLKSMPEVQYVVTKMEFQLENLKYDSNFVNELEILYSSVVAFNKSRSEVLNATLGNNLKAIQIIIRFLDNTNSLLNAIDDFENKVNMIISINSKLIGISEKTNDREIAYLKLKYDTDDIDIEFMSNNLVHIKKIVDLIKSKLVYSEQYIDLAKIESGSLFDLLIGDPDSIETLKLYFIFFVSNFSDLVMIRETVFANNLYKDYLSKKGQYQEIELKEQLIESQKLDNEYKKEEITSKKLENIDKELDIYEKISKSGINYSALDKLCEKYGLDNDEIHMLLVSSTEAFGGNDNGVSINEVHYKKQRQKLIGVRNSDTSLR